MTEPVHTARGPTRRGGTTGRARGLVFAALLAALAGIVDAIGYLHLSGLFLSYMSGNSTQLAVALGQGNLGEAGTIAELIAFFVSGAAAGQLLADLSGGWHMTCVLSVVTIFLAVAAVLGTVAAPMVFAMGALNASMHRAGGIAVSLTFVTGALVRFGQGLGDLLARRSSELQWLAQAAPWFGLIAGATVGSAAYMRIGEPAIWVAVVLAGLLAAGSAAMLQPD